jgi:20S proteasome alpha/beta subunit
VTLIIGIICKDGIVLAADSQTTKGAARQLGTNKIRVVEFGNGKAIVAESGSASLSARAIEVFQRKAAGRKIEDDSTIAKAAEESVREIRSSLTSLHPNCNFPDRWQQFFNEDINYFELMLAYYFEGKPHLYKLNPLWCIPVPATAHFMTSGIAGDLANYVLQEYANPGMESELASVVAIKAVEDAIEYVEGCGGPPRVALIRTPTGVPPLVSPASSQVLGISPNFQPYAYYTDPVVIFPREKVEGIAKVIASVEQRMKAAQNKSILKALRSQTGKLFQAWMKELDI